MRPKARVYKLKNAYGRNPWVCIHRSGIFGVFSTWVEAMEYLTPERLR